MQGNEGREREGGGVGGGRERERETNTAYISHHQFWEHSHELLEGGKGCCPRSKSLRTLVIFLKSEANGA